MRCNLSPLGCISNCNKLRRIYFRILTLRKEGSSVKHVPRYNVKPLNNLFYCWQMIECSSCGEWFHRMYERVKDDKYDESNTGDWLCSKCLPDL